MITKSYLYHLNDSDIEVISTGRYTSKILPTSKISVKRVEIKPLDNDLKWSKFVDESELCEIFSEKD
jgi:hypothetical protein